MECLKRERNIGNKHKLSGGKRASGEPRLNDLIMGEYREREPPKETEVIFTYEGGGGGGEIIHEVVSAREYRGYQGSEGI